MGLDAQMVNEADHLSQAQAKDAEAVYAELLELVSDHGEIDTLMNDDQDHFFPLVSNLVRAKLIGDTYYDQASELINAILRRADVLAQERVAARDPE